MSIEDNPRLDPRTVARALGGDLWGGNNINAPSPGHSKRDRSLKITIDPDAPGGFVLHSFVGDDPLMLKDWVREQIGLQPWRPSPPNGATNGHAREPAKAVVAATYDYRLADETPYLRVTRMTDKTFRQSHWDGATWQSRAPEGPKVPYRLPELLAADPDEPVFYVEGEKDADRLWASGLVATTHSGGAHGWTGDLAQWLSGRQIFILPDNDKDGRELAHIVGAALEGSTVIALEGLPVKGDVSDWLNAGHTAADLLALTFTPPEPEPPSALAPTPFAWINPQDLPRRQWLYGRHLIRKYVSTTIAPGGLGKSSLIIVESLAMTSGRELLGESLPAGPLRVWYWNGEDGQDENRYRTVAAASHHGIAPEDFASRLWQDSGREKELLIATAGARAPFEVNEALIAELIAHITLNRIDVLIIDPFVAAHQVGENDNGAINAVVRALGRVAEFGNCAVELVHHIRKPGAGITADTDVNDARGASALIGGVRSARVLNVMSEEDAERYGVENRLAYFHVDNGKANLAPRSEVAVWRRIVSFDLGNGGNEDFSGDKIGVVEKWSPPSLFAGLSSRTTDLVKEIISKGIYRHDWRSSDWAGYALGQTVAIDPTGASGRKKLCEMIETWIENGIIRKENRADNKRMLRAFLVCDPPEYMQPTDVCPSDEY